MKPGSLSIGAFMSDFLGGTGGRLSLVRLLVAFSEESLTSALLRLSASNISTLSLHCISISRKESCSAFSVSLLGR